MERKRVASRRRTLKAGTIEFGGGGIDCTVRNISDTGAALEVASPLFIPDRFTLYVLSDQFKRPCHIIWRQGKRIGVEFE
jgi:PilZ domain